jgi:hypothetical protein
MSNEFDDIDEVTDLLQDLAANTAGCLPMLPLPSLPIPGFPLLPSFDVPSLPDLKIPDYLAARPEDLILEQLYELVIEFGLDVDLDVDLDVKKLVKVILSTAEELGVGQLAALQARITQALVATTDLITPPVLPLPSLPIPGFPLLPSFDFSFSVPTGPPSFMIDTLKTEAQDKLVELIASLGLDIDLDIDISASEAIEILEDAAKQLGPGEVGRIQAAVTKILAVNPADLFTPPPLPLPSLPIPGFPLLPSFDFDLSLDIECPQAEVANWLKQ